MDSCDFSASRLEYCQGSGGAPGGPLSTVPPSLANKLEQLVLFCFVFFFFFFLSILCIGVQCRMLFK